MLRLETTAHRIKGRLGINFSRKLALRIALATRVQPDVDVPRLIGRLRDKVSSLREDEKLKALTITNLKNGIGLESIKLSICYGVRRTAMNA